MQLISTLAIVMCSMLPNLWLYRGSNHKAMNPQNYGTICQDMPRHYTRLALSENRVHMPQNPVVYQQPENHMPHVNCHARWCKTHFKTNLCGGFLKEGTPNWSIILFSLKRVNGFGTPVWSSHHMWVDFLRKKQQIPMANHIQPSFPPLRHISRCSHSHNCHNCHNLGVPCSVPTSVSESKSSRQGIHPAELLRRSATKATRMLLPDWDSKQRTWWYGHTGWCPPVISWFITPINYSYICHKP